MSTQQEPTQPTITEATAAAIAVLVPLTVHVPDMRYVAMDTTGNENTQPRLLTPAETKWMKRVLQDEIGNGVTRLYRGEIVEVPGYAVWLCDLGADVKRDPVIEKRETAARARRNVRRTEFVEAV